MDEQRKYAILFAATILAVRKLSEIGSRPCPARECAISDAISNAELILKRIDEHWACGEGEGGAWMRSLFSSP